MLDIRFFKEEDFVELLPLIEKFAQETKKSFSEQVASVAFNFHNGNNWTCIVRDGTGIKAYSHFVRNMNKEHEAILVQVLSVSPDATKAMVLFMDGFFMANGITKITTLWLYAPRLAEMYGFRTVSLYMEKELCNCMKP